LWFQEKGHEEDMTRGEISNITAQQREIKKELVAV